MDKKQRPTGATPREEAQLVLHRDADRDRTSAFRDKRRIHLKDKAKARMRRKMRRATQQAMRGHGR